MAKLFLSFLGVGNYIPCHYGLPEEVVLSAEKAGKKKKKAQKGSIEGGGEESGVKWRAKDGKFWTLKPVEYVQEALVRVLCHDWGEGDRVVVVTTDDAKKKHWFKEGAERGVGAGQGEGEGKEKLPCLKECLEVATEGTGLTVERLDIPVGLKEGELWEMFRKVYEKIEPGDELYLDITHAFRSIPMIGFTVLEHARSLKEATVEGIFYGAFETLGSARDIKKRLDDENDPLVHDDLEAPVFDLTPLWLSHRWSVGINSFIKYGQAGGLLDVIGEVLRTKHPGTCAPKERSAIIKKRQALESLNNYLIQFSQAHLLGNIPALVGLKSSEMKFDEVLEEMGDLMPQALMGPLVDEFKEAHAPYEVSGGKRILEAIRWCLGHELYPQAMTLAREAVDTAACVEAGISDWWDKDKGRGRAISAVTGLIKAQDKSGDKKARNKGDLGEREETGGGEDRPEVEDVELYELLKARWSEEDFKDVVSLKEIRNDLNHGGTSDHQNAEKMARGRDIKKTLAAIAEKCCLRGEALRRSPLLKVLERWDGSVDGGRVESEEEGAEGGGKMLCLMNHPLTQEQKKQAKEQLGVEELVLPPKEVSEAFAQIPPEEADVSRHLRGAVEWVREKGSEGDCFLVQGEFGATYGLVRFAQSLGMRAVHATTKRESEEVVLEDGTVSTKRVFRHVLFREYGPIGTLC